EGQDRVVGGAGRVGDLQVVLEVRATQVLLKGLGGGQVVGVPGGERGGQLLDRLGGGGVEGEILVGVRRQVDRGPGPGVAEVLLLRIQLEVPGGVLGRCALD